MGLDAKYDQFYGGRAGGLSAVHVDGWPKNRVEAIVKMPLQGGVLLDVGCGDGKLLYQFRDRFKTLVGLEFSSARLKVAENNLRGFDFRGVAGSAEEMTTIASDSIDCIVSADVIEHIPDVYQACDEMFRVLKPGGVLIMNTPNIAFVVKRLRLLLGRFPSTSQRNEGLGSDVLFDGGHFHYFTYRSLRLLLERSGFVMESKLGFGRFGRLHDMHPELLSVGVQWAARKPA